MKNQRQSLNLDYYIRISNKIEIFRISMWLTRSVMLELRHVNNHHHRSLAPTARIYQEKQHCSEQLSVPRIFHTAPGEYFLNYKTIKTCSYH